MNIFQFIGRLTKNPELKYLPDQTAVCEFNIAINRKNNGADFPRLKAYGKEAENLEQYKRQGDLIAVTGHVKTGSFEKDDRVIYTQDLIVDHIEYLTSKREMKAEARNETEPAPKAEYFGNYDF